MVLRRWVASLGVRRKRRAVAAFGLVLLFLLTLNTWPGVIAAPSPSAATYAAAQQSGPVLYTFDLRSAFQNQSSPIGPLGVEEPVPGKTYARLLQDYDLTVFVSTLQGIVNRERPRLYTYHAPGVDDYWLQTFQTPGEWLADYTIVPIPDLATLLEIFGAEVTGTVVWDEHLPATLNVATTIAGVENTPVIRRGSDLYDQVTRVIPVRIDLSGRFASKAEAYRWAASEYLATGRCAPDLLAYVEDGWPAVLYQNRSLPRGAATVFARDYLVQNRAFVFDLSPWTDEAPIDEPDQPLGQDAAVFHEILATARAQAGEAMIAMWGFFPWWDKYSNRAGAGGSRDPAEGEWETIWLASMYGAYATGNIGDAFGLDMANTSVHRFAPFPERVARPASPTLDNLQAKGFLQGSRVAPKTYLLYYIGDFDYAQPLYSLLPELWQDPHRGDLPLAWGLNPQHVRILPDILSYMLRTRTTSDYFVAANSGAGYLNPEALPADLRPSWQEHNRTYYHRLGLTITGFFLNGKGGEVTDEIIDLYSAFSPDGLTVNYNQLVGEWPRLRGNTPLTAFPHYGLNSSDSLEVWISQVDGAYAQYRDAHGISRPVFITLRCVYTSPSFLFQLTQELRLRHPERDYQVVDPYTYFFLLRQELDGENSRRATFLPPTLPEQVTTGETIPLRLAVRNDGWDTWPADSVGLGFNIAAQDESGESPDDLGQALFLPLTQEVAPGAVYTFTFLLGAPLRPGTYELQYDILEQPWQWFHTTGYRWAKETFTVSAPLGGMGRETPSLPRWPTAAPIGPQGLPGMVTPGSPTAAGTLAPLSTTEATPVPSATAGALPSGWEQPPAVQAGLGNRAVWAIAADAQGRTWFGGEQGVASFAPGDDTTTDDDQWQTYGQEHGLPHPWVSAIATDGKGGVWFGTQGGGAAYLDASGWTVYTEADGLASNWVRDIAVDAQGRVWFATSKGVSVFSGSAWQTFTRNNSPLPRDVVSAVAIDRQGNYWLATEGGGVSRLSQDGREWQTFGAAEGLGDDFVLALAVDKQDHVWAGTWRGGLSMFDGQRWQTYTTDNSGLAANWVQAVAVDAAGRIWCGTYGLPGGGLSVLTPSSGQWVRYGTGDGLPSDNVTALAVTRPGEVWVGTELGGIRYLEPLLLFGPGASPAPDDLPEPTIDPRHREYSWYGGGGEQNLGTLFGQLVAVRSGQPPPPTPTRMPSPTPTNWTPTGTATRMPSPTPTGGATSTPTASPTFTPSPTGPTPTPTRTSTPSPTSATATPTRTSTPTATRTATPSPTVTGTPPTVTPTYTPTPRTPSPTPTPCGVCPTSRPAPPPTPPPLPTREADLDETYTFTTRWGSVMRINERPSSNALRVPETRGIGGRAVRVYVNADTLVWVAGVQLEFSYDTGLLTASGVNLTPRSDAMTRPEPAIDTDKGKVNVLLFSAEGQAIPPGRGPIVSLLFEVREGAQDRQKAQIHITRAILADVDGNEVKVPAQYIYDGYLVICSSCFLHNGDVDKDGEVTIIDVQRGINIVLGRHIADDEEVVALDINGDGTADVLDVIKVVNLALGRELPAPWPTPTLLPTVTPTPAFSPTPTATAGTPPPTATPGTPATTPTATAATPLPTAATPPPTATVPPTPGSTATPYPPTGGPAQVPPPTQTPATTPWAGWYGLP